MRKVLLSGALVMIGLAAPAAPVLASAAASPAAAAAAPPHPAFSTTHPASGFARASAEVIAEAPPSCGVLFCSEVPLADFGQVSYSGLALTDTAGTKGSLSAFDANEITMVNNGTTLATPSSLSPDGTSFSVTWDNS